MRFALIMTIALAATAVARASDPLEEKAQSIDAKDPEQLLHMGNLFLEAERVKDAKRMFKTAALRMLDKTDAQLGLALIRVKEEKLHNAKLACRKLKETFPNSNASNICYGEMWLKFGRSARAMEEFEPIAKNGDDFRAKTGLAKTYALMSDYDKAQAAYEDAVATGAGYEALIGLGLLLEAKGDVNKAKSMLSQAVEAEPLSCQAQYNYGRILGKGDTAILHLQKALEIRPQWSDALGEIGAISLASGKTDQALKAFTEAVDLEPGRGAFHLGLGTSLYKAGKFSQARSALNKALEIVPNYVDATLMLADVELAAGDQFEASDLAERAVALSPNNPKVCRDTAKIFYRMERYTKANAYFTKATSMEPKNSESYVFLGDIACKRRMFDDGKSYYKKALEGDLSNTSKSEIQNKIGKCR